MAILKPVRFQFIKMSGDIIELPSTHSIDEIIKDRGLRDACVIVESGSVKGSNYLGEIFKIKINGIDKNGSKQTLSLIMKIAPRIAEFRQKVPIATLFQREIFTYTELLPVLFEIQEKYQLPQEDRFHYAKLLKSLTPSTGEMMIFEDLGIQGFKPYDRCNLFDYDHLSLAIKNIARYHATTIVLKEENPQFYNQIDVDTSNILDFGEGFNCFTNKCYENAVNLLEDSDRDHLRTYFQNQFDIDFQRALDSKTSAPYNVICHGDCWPNNFLFAYQNGKVHDMRMLDWQTICCSSPLIDISYIMFTSMDEEMLRKYLREMLELYYHTLSHNISKMGFKTSVLFPKHIYEEHIKTYMRYGLILAIAILPIKLADNEKIYDPNAIFDREICEKAELIFSNTCEERLKGIIKFCIAENII